MSVHLSADTHACICTDQKSTSGIIPYLWSNLVFQTGSLIGLELSRLTGNPEIAQQPQGPTSLLPQPRDYKCKTLYLFL